MIRLIAPIVLLAAPARAYADVTPVGYLDTATTGSLPTVQGWARDDDYAGPIDVHVYIQYNGTGPVVFLTRATANNCSEAAVGGVDGNDSSCNGTGGCSVSTPCKRHRFSIPYGALGSGHKIYVYAIGVNSSGTPNSVNPVLTNSPATVSNLPIALTTGVQIWDSDRDCRDKPAQIDVFVMDRTNPGSPAWRYHGRGYTNAPQYQPNPYDFGTFISFKFPISTSFTPGDILIRQTKHNSCSGDTYLDWSSSSNYNDYSPTAVYTDSDYRGAGRTITLQNTNYRALADRNGGAFYEYYNRRMGDPGLPNNDENAVHANFGAALQIAMHSGAVHSLDSSPCAFQGYWNPTQAGASCGTSSPLAPMPGTDLTITCDGSTNNSCTSATTATWGQHRMMNWDYGTTYTGPYNAADLLKLTQTVDATNADYMTVDVTLFNDSGTARTGALEIPTFYFTNRFRRYYWPSYTDTVNGTSPSSAAAQFATTPGATDGQNAAFLALETPSGDPSHPFCYDPGWITAENTFASSASHPFITVAWLYKGSFLDEASPDQAACGPASVSSRWALAVSEQAWTDMVKMTNAPRITLAASTTYNFRYVIFPYKYNETITTSYGTHTVAETIALMRAVYR